MTVNSTNNSFSIGNNQNMRRIRYQSMPQLLLKHLNSDPTTPCIEAYVAAIARADFPIDRVVDLVRVVCKWGNRSPIGIAVRDNNTRRQIQKSLRSAKIRMDNNEPERAIEEITRLGGLGISFGSKHLKFINPARAVVLDSIISRGLGYRLTPAGYVSFLGDCWHVCNMLNDRNIVCTAARHQWRVSDVEMAIYKHLMN